MVIWLIGLSGAGKTTIGRVLVDLMRAEGRSTLFLDGDDLRSLWQEDLHHQLADRRKNHMRFSRLCALLDQDDHVDIVVSALSIFPDYQKWNRENFNQYYEVFLNLPVADAIERDSKGLYAKALAGTLQNVVGIDIPFPVPPNPDLVIEPPQIHQPPALLGEFILSRLPERRRHG